MKDLNLFYKIDPNLRVLLIPLVLIIVSLGLLVFSVNMGYKQITGQLGQLNEIEEREIKLATKLEILREVQAGLLEYSNASLIAVPDKNPVAWTSSLLKKSIYQNNLTLKKVKGNARLNDGALYDVILGLELGGELKDLMSFAGSTMEMAPIIKIKSMDISKEKDSYVAKVESVTHWADLPKKLPALDEPITTLSENELRVLADLKTLLRPEFNVLEPQTESSRQSPFR